MTADLRTGKAVVHRRGELAASVAASMSIPGWAPPVRDGDRLLVDGGILNNFPVDVMAAAGEGPVIGVDAMGMGGRSQAGPVVGDDGDRDQPRLPTIMEALAGAATLGSRRVADVNARAAAMVIRPDVDGTRLLDFDRLDQLLDAGRRAAHDAVTAAGSLIRGSA